MHLEALLARTERAIAEQVTLSDFEPCKVSMWLKFVKLQPVDGTNMEVNITPVQKVIFTASSFAELVQEVAENMVLAVYGADAPPVKELPNLIVKLFDQKARIATPGAPPLEEEGQIFLKATVYRYEPSLWERLFGRDGEDPSTPSA
jgi:hypothetical protein